MTVTQAISPDTRALADLFAAASVGDIVTYDQMSQAIGRPIAGCRYLALRGMAIANRETGAIYGNIIRAGYRRLPAQDAHMLGAHARGRFRRTAKRTSAAIVAAVSNANDMPDDARRRAYAEVNAMALVRHIAADKQVAAAAPEAEAKAEPIAIVMRRFALAIGAVE
jgi:hypothetical protein